MKIVSRQEGNYQVTHNFLGRSPLGSFHQDSDGHLISDSPSLILEEMDEHHAKQYESEIAVRRIARQHL
ncbi:MAG: hypothetical protein UX86_C0021G0005 [Candidatus Amesbacteria bacterium GW2011_GWC1_47_15]|uniref:Uncharacterized protein n=1 Tax=Candidatus Amesbacteria bacterium GW2011_GWC1_47_15 TaxID=1618364 RepID=A0A0G1UBV0_9BACT|nr:MAG: hypothetical protein UX86_C0021G0005 [Candidatus Amesbacteria bacterium GW2011_GWC1_47_15]